MMRLFYLHAFTAKNTNKTPSLHFAYRLYLELTSWTLYAIQDPFLIVLIKRCVFLPEKTGQGL